MPRAFLLVLDSFGIGASEDAAAYGDAGADTLGHIADACAAGQGDRAGLRSGPLSLPNLDGLGLGAAGARLDAAIFRRASRGSARRGCGGMRSSDRRARTRRRGIGRSPACPVTFDWGYFPQTVPAFPPELVAAIVAEAGIPGILGERHASGTEIIAELGAESIRTGKPIFYTSADSVLQIAAHEEAFGLERLLDALPDRPPPRRPAQHRPRDRPALHRRAPSALHAHGQPARLCDPAARADTHSRPLSQAPGRAIVTVGKIGDIFAHRSTGEILKGASQHGAGRPDARAMRHLAGRRPPLRQLCRLRHALRPPPRRRGLCRRARGVRSCASRSSTPSMRPGDVMILTADHGCDPTWPGTDHTREHVPMLAFGPGVTAGADRPARDVRGYRRQRAALTSACPGPGRADLSFRRRRDKRPKWRRRPPSMSS